jgi:hypothetical protein
MFTGPDLSLSGFALIGFLVLLGACLILTSIVVNKRVATSVAAGDRNREKVYEYTRNTFSQLGVILLGIGVSLFIFFFQQNHLEQKRRQAELQNVTAQMSVRVSHVAATARWLTLIDEILDDGGPFRDPEIGGSNNAVTATGPDLVRQVESIRRASREMDFEDFGEMGFSPDMETSDIVNQMDAHLWFGMIDDERELEYAVEQVEDELAGLGNILDGEPSAAILTSPEKHEVVKEAVLQLLPDLDLLRDRSRRLLGRGCWLLSNAPDFAALEPIVPLEMRYETHQEWLDAAREHLSEVSIGANGCYAILSPPEME